MKERILQIGVLLFIFMVAAQSNAASFLVEAPSLEATGDWQRGHELHIRGEFLTVGSTKQPAPAAGAVELPRAGRWKLWVLSKDFPADRPGSRNFTIRVGTQPSARLFGRHNQTGIEGWVWEDGGSFDLPAGPVLIVIGEKSTSSARCHSLVLTDDQWYRPKGLPHQLKLPVARMAALSLKTVDESRRLLPEPVKQIDPAAIATLENEQVRWTFHYATTAVSTVIVQQAAVRVDGQWKALVGEPSAESYRVLFRPKDKPAKVIMSQVHPAWDTSLSQEIEVSAGGASVKTRLGPPTAPWASGQCFSQRPSSVRQLDKQTVELGFPALSVGQLTATWRLSGSQPEAKVALNFIPSVAGAFSLGYHGMVTAAPTNCDFLLMPFMFQALRFPKWPVTLPNALMPTPLALINRAKTSYALVAEPEDLPFEWQGATTSRYLFGLRNETGQAQPFLYTPVLGLSNSLAETSVPILGRFRVWAQPGDWFAAYQQVATRVFNLTDYRRPTTASLSDAALNLFDLLRDDKASGWDARAKGAWNIESRNTVSHSSPLTYLSFYLLTGDEEFYRRHALPALEFMISRPSAHFAAEREIDNNYYHHQPMHGPAPLYGASTFAGASAMTQGHVPLFSRFCVETNGQARASRGYSHMQPFEETLALYRLTGEAHWRESAMAQADQYIAANITRLPQTDLGVMPFLNISFVPDWEGLLHLYEATGEKRFLEAATEGAHWLLTTLWVQPLIPSQEVTIHPGGVYKHANHVWWKGDYRYRLGLVDGAHQVYDEAKKPVLPPTMLPEKRVPAWQVSNVGLGLEQPCTYTRSGQHANILMSTWAPNLLRLAQLTGEPMFRTAARNATIGRFANYPGYYVDGMTDRYQQPDYPLTGSDVTTIYYHHIPPFAAYVLDYLFTDAEIRSEGAVTFPSVRQAGYAWFDNRLRGHAPGSVYGENAWPWLHRTAATVDTINVDRVLAHSENKFHVVLLNQVPEVQGVRVKFDPKVLGCSLEGMPVAVRLNNKPAPSLTVKENCVSLTLNPLGIASLTLEGVKIDVPTHRAMPPAKLAVPTENALCCRSIPGTKLEAIGTELVVPPFTWRDLYVYLSAGIDDCKTVTLCYRIGGGSEQRVKIDRFPWEFSVRTTELDSPITWKLDVQLSDGRSVCTQ